MPVLALACTHVPRQHFQLESLKVAGNSQLDDDEIEERLASRETPQFLGVFPGVIYEYEVFNRFVLERDLQRIERLYRSRGYYQARVRAARVFRHGAKVRVEIVVDEDEPVLLTRIDVHGIERLPADVRAEALQSVSSRLPLGAAFEEAAFEAAAETLLRGFADRGYARATVRRSADVNLPEGRASVGYWVTPGEVSELGAVSLVGLGDLPEAKIRRTLGLAKGDRYSQSELDEAKRALLDLGVFGSVKIEPQLKGASGFAGPTSVPIVVSVERSKLRSVRFGGGVQLDAIKSDVHLSLGWQDQSFLGGLRKLVIEVTPGVVVYPTRIPSLEAPERLLPQGRVRTEFRQPGFLESRSHGILKAQLSVAPSLLATEHEPNAPILGYRDYRVSAGIERSFRRLFGNFSQNLQINVPFAYAGRKSDALAPVVISYPALFASLDLRDNSLKPRAGIYASSELQLAGIFGDARDVKLRPELRAYVPLTRRTTLAARGAFGLLFPSNYGSTVNSNALTGHSGLVGPADETLKTWVRDIQLLFFRGFFAGGAGSNRGYAAREIGPHGVIPYYIPGQSSTDIDASCTLGPGLQPASSVCDLPLGGFTLWEASLELRYPIVSALGGTLFTDAADVSSRQLSFRWRPHLSVGAGLRYDTPVGPIRLDVGYRLPGLQAPAGAADEGRPTDLLTLPIAVSFGIGESF